MSDVSVKEFETFEQLAEERRSLVNSLKRNDFFEPDRRHLTELYDDNTHFIYELLQNAEDARDFCNPFSSGATKVSFTLKNNALEFEHNGEGLFTLANVVGITGRGNSTKRDDPTSIGKFGIGFKSVFAYTNTPEIHSGDFHFRIHDLYVPDTEGVLRRRMSEKETRFIFPFNNPRKKSELAVEEIEKGLCSLGDNTLLFLRHIERIECCLTDGTLWSLERLDDKEGHLEIRATNGTGKIRSSYWHRFQKRVEVVDEDDRIKDCEIAIAFKLEEDNENWKIVPAEPGEVSIYFPAVKTSNLRFHMHAPFASTVARDCIRNDCAANMALRDHLTALVVESLTVIRDKGMLTVDFLAVLPNPADNLPSFYEPIRKAIVEAFENEKLTPTKNGSHAPATELYRGPVSISSVLSDDDIALLTGGVPPLWAANPPPQSRRVESFLDSLDIEEWEWYELSNAFDSYDTDKQRSIENWIAQKNDSWLMRFYALLGEAHDQHSKHFDVQKLHIVRVEAEQGHEHVTPGQAFFPPEQEGIFPPEVHFVKQSVYSSGRSETQKKSAVSFLRHIGVRPYDSKAEVELILKEYRNREKISRNNNVRHVRQFVALWIERQSAIEMFKRVKFLRADNEMEGYYSAADLYLDTPYAETGMAALFNDSTLNIEKRKMRISDGYKAIKNFKEFAIALGVMQSLEFVEGKATSGQKNFFSKKGEKTATTIDVDYFINGINDYFVGENLDGYIGFFDINACRSLALSRVLWLTMSKANPDVLIARYERMAFKNSKTSSVVDILTTKKWVPDNKGDFRRPCEVTKETLHPNFSFDDRNGWLTAIKFGENARKCSEEYLAKNQTAKVMGFTSAEQAAKWVEVAKLGISPDEFIAHHKQTEQPGESVRDPNRRRAGVLERTDNAPAKESVRRERTIQSGISQDTAEAKAYLRGKYTNQDGQLICQCCHKKMPFKIGEDHYFEAIQCLRNLDRRYYENRLALCPTCSAMYQHANETDKDEMRRRLINLDADDTAPAVEISVRLAGSDYLLHFVGTHWFDLKTILSSS